MPSSFMHSINLRTGLTVVTQQCLHCMQGGKYYIAACIAPKPGQLEWFEADLGDRTMLQLCRPSDEIAMRAGRQKSSVSAAAMLTDW